MMDVVKGYEKKAVSSTVVKGLPNAAEQDSILTLEDHVRELFCAYLDQCEESSV